MAPPSISLERLSPVVLFILTLSLTGQAQAHVLPRETVRPTTTLPYHHLDVVSWPLTTPPPTPFTPTFNGKAIPRRASSVGSFNTICGYIGGRLDLPATCSAGSHCVLAPAQGAVGCCPNGGPCTSGIYTGCVDVNSPPQTEIDPYVYTCTGAKVCYQNVYDGGYSQFGCGTASDMATTVRTAAGTASVVLSSLPSVSLTAPIKSLTTPITIGSRTHSWTSSEIPSSSKTRSGTTPGTSSALGPSSTAASSASSSTVISGEFATTAPAAAGSARGADKVAAIIGGTLSGLALFVTLFVVAYMLWRRNRANPRHGPGEKCGYSSSGSPSPDPIGPNDGFTLAQNYERRRQFDPMHSSAMAQAVRARGDDAPTTTSWPAAEAATTTEVTEQSFRDGSSLHFTVVGRSRFIEDDHLPLRLVPTSTLEKCVTDGNTSDDAVWSNASNVGDYSATYQYGEAANPPVSKQTGGPDRPLWQQNRRHSRGIVWI